MHSLVALPLYSPQPQFAPPEGPPLSMYESRQAFGRGGGRVVGRTDSYRESPDRSRGLSRTRISGSFLESFLSISSAPDARRREEVEKARRAMKEAIVAVVMRWRGAN